MATASARHEMHQRLDDMLDERISTALRQSPYLQSRTLRFETSDGGVTLRGQVASWYQKQMAQEALLRLDGIDRVTNELEVCWS